MSLFDVYWIISTTGGLKVASVFSNVKNTSSACSPLTEIFNSSPLRATKVINDKIDYSEIQRCIDRKEKKLIEYKKLEKNQSIDEYWLNINIPLTEKVVYKQEDTYNVESGYKRIYLSTYELGDKPLRIK